MYTDRKQSHLMVLVMTAILALALLYTGMSFRQTFPKELEEESITAIKNAVRECALQCYVTEGVYPPDIAYLQENYGLRINTEAYIVAYEAYAENQMPDIRVVKRNR